MGQAYWPECDGPLVRDYVRCGGQRWRYRREATSFGVPFMTSACFCAAHFEAVPWWHQAERLVLATP